MAVQAHIGQRCQPVNQLIAQGADARCFFGNVGGGQLDGFRHAHNTRYVLSAGAAAALLSAAVDQVINARALLNIERAYALGTMELVAGQRQQIAADGTHVHGDCTDGLHCVRVEQHMVRMGDLGDFLNGFDGADFVVGGHDGNQDGFVGNGRFHIGWIDQAVRVHGHIGDFKPLLFQPFAGVQDGVVLDGGGDDVVALLAVGKGHALERPVIAFAAAGGEVHFFGVAVQRGRYLLAGGVERLARIQTGGMNAVGVAVAFRKIGKHFFKHCGGYRRGGGVIHINAVQDSFISFDSSMS